MNLLDRCTPRILQEGAVSTAASFDACLPFGARIYSKGGIVEYEAPSVIPPDGVYTSITVKNGCIVGVGDADLPVLHGPSCPVLPAACGLGGSAVSGYGSVVIQNGSGISVTGSGSAANPYVISWTGGSSAASDSVHVQIGNDAIIVSGTGSAADPYQIGHKTSGQFDTIAGMRFDQYGHLVSYTAGSSSLGLNAVVEGYGISVTTEPTTKLATIALAKPAHPIASPGQTRTLALGGYDVTFDSYNRIYDISKISHAAGVLTISCITRVINNTNKTFTIILAEDARIKVELDLGVSALASSEAAEETQTSTYTVSIDDETIDPTFVNAYRVIYIPSAQYAAGTHNVNISSPDRRVAATISASL